jgi:hypothetical protein
MSMNKYFLCFFLSKAMYYVNEIDTVQKNTYFHYQSTSNNAQFLQSFWKATKNWIKFIRFVSTKIEECVSRKVEGSLTTFFWTNPWLDGFSLRDRFKRLFGLSENKSSMVAEMFSLGWEVEGDVWVWRRQLWEEDMVKECQTLLHDFSLQAQYPDRW